MLAYIVAMIAILVVAGAVVGLVLIGMEGRGKARMPWISDKLTRLAGHLNGEVEPPETFTRVMERSRFSGRHHAEREHSTAGK